MQRNDLYDELSSESIKDIQQTQEEIKVFKDLYAKELLTNRDVSLTLEIIRNLEKRIEDEKREYTRLKTVSDSC